MESRSRVDANEIAEVLHVLVGLRLQKVVFIESLRSFQFTSKPLEAKLLDEPGDIALHVDCPWRLERKSTIITGCQDSLADENGNPIGRNWDPQASRSLEQSIWNRLFNDPSPMRMRNHTRDFVVERMDADACGDAAIIFTSGYTLRLFPCSTALESWRIFKSGDLESHFVIPPDSERPSNG